MSCTRFFLLLRFSLFANVKTSTNESHQMFQSALIITRKGELCVGLGPRGRYTMASGDLRHTNSAIDPLLVHRSQDAVLNACEHLPEDSPRLCLVPQSLTMNLASHSPLSNIFTSMFNRRSGFVFHDEISCPFSSCQPRKSIDSGLLLS